MGDGPYSRVYWTVFDDAKFDGIRENVRHFGSWSLMLVVADMAHPASGLVPRCVPPTSLQTIVDAGLVDLLSGGRFRIRGLSKERDMRSQSARNAAAVRWHSNGNAGAMLEEKSIEETRLTKGLGEETREGPTSRPVSR